jgi:glycosyltransferase involved in cell wall biosynthesis
MRRVLVSAYACEPGRGSEGEIGWSLVHELAKRNEVWVLTRANNRSVHEAAFTRESKPSTLHFVYYDMPAWARWYKRGKRLFLVYYYIWQLGSAFEARRVARAEGIDLVHHLTGGMDWMPSGLVLAGLPFVWGPVGSERTPAEIMKTLPLRLRMKERIRLAVQWYGRHLDPLVRLTGKRADTILSHTAENLPRRYGKKVVPHVQTGISRSPRFAQLKASFTRGTPVTIIFAGELVHWKGAGYAVDAFIACAREGPDMRLVVVGDGPLRAQLEQRVMQSGASQRVTFKGRQPMEELTHTLAMGDIFLYPSYHHGLATVVLQAMLTGLPVVCLQGDANGRAVGTECGLAIRFAPDSDVTKDLAAALRRLVDDEALRARLAEGARRTATERYSYEAIGSVYEEIYRRVLERGCGGNRYGIR